MALLARDSPMSPLLVGFFRVALATPCFWLAARGLGERRLALAGADRWRLGLAGLAQGTYQVCYFYAVAWTSVAVAALIAICSAPLLIVALAALLLGERVTPRTAAALGLGVTGAALLTAGPHGLRGLPAGFLAGIGLALVAGLCYALYAVLAKDLLRRVPPVGAAAGAFGVAALALAPTLATEPVVAGPRAWLLLVYLGVVPTALAYVAYMIGLRTTPVTASGVVALLEPLTATLLGVVFFGNRLGTVGVAGALLLLAAVAILAVRESPPARP
jgi:drug/metabolite transporter, DME family